MNQLQSNKASINSLRFEISILNAIILGIVLIAFSGALYIISNIFFKQIDNDIELKAKEISQTIKSYEDAYASDPNGLLLAIEKTIAMQAENLFKLKGKRIADEWQRRSHELDLTRDYINFVTPLGVSIYSSKNMDEKLLKSFLDDFYIPKNNQMTFRKITHKKKDIRIINYPFISRDGKNYIIQVGVTRGPMASILQNWLYCFAISIPLILLLTNYLGRLLAARILAPVFEITRLAESITHHDLSARIKSKQFDMEMKDLVDAFNDMISRLEKSFKHIEEFSSHVAHELKTPLTIIKGEAQLALRKERTPEEYRRVIQINLEEAERMLKTTEDLLLLTKLDFQPEVFKFEQISSADFFKELHERVKVLAAPKGINVTLNMPEHGTILNADRTHLRRCFFNIIDNAIKFTPQNGSIKINVKSNGRKLIATITDSGVGIPKESLGKVFEKFFRVHHNGEVGNGLGLSIVYAIVKIHQGDVDVDSQVGVGTTFKISLPCQSSS